MRITVLELPAEWDAVDSVIELADAALADGPETDLVLFPEAALTGYVSPEGVFDLSPFAEPIDGPTVRRLASLARARAVHLVAPLVLEERGRLFNTMVALAPNGAVLFVYRKRHPWLPEQWAHPGPFAPPLIEIGGARVTIATCYDIHFLEESSTILEQADLLLFPSAWVDPDERQTPHDLRFALLRSTAERFGLAIANANWAPGRVVCPGQGRSCIVDSAGNVIAQAAPDDLRVDATIT